MVVRSEGLERSVSRALQAFAESPRNGNETSGFWDAGPPILADLAREAARDTAGLPGVEAICEIWIEGGPAASSFALCGGLASLMHGLRCAARGSPAVATLHGRVRTSVTEMLSTRHWARPAVDWHDYDLVSGPAGLCLAFCADPDAPPTAIHALADHLAQLLRSEDMVALRITGCRGDPLRGWNFGQVNLGLAHGVAGPIAALTAAIRHLGGDARPSYAETLEMAADWLAARSHRDTRGLTTWAPAWRDPGSALRPASRREAWCYGAPAAAWVLWDAGDLFGRADLCGFALETFETFAAGFDMAFHLDDDPDEKLAICHGAAGILLVADCFARHAGTAAGESLARAQEEFLCDRLSEVEDLAVRNPTVLDGGMGILAALLTRRGGDRGWLATLALR